MSKLPKQLIEDLKAGNVLSLWVNPSVTIESFMLIERKEIVAS